jgi:hypothetical protein
VTPAVAVPSAGENTAVNSFSTALKDWRVTPMGAVGHVGDALYEAGEV